MAQLLIFQRDNVNTKDDSGSYKTGDVVLVAEDSHVFSATEQQHPFALVQVAGAKADYDYLTESEPQTLRNKYPRALLAIKRLMLPLAKTLQLPDTRLRRKHSVGLDAVVARKQTGAV